MYAMWHSEKNLPTQSSSASDFKSLSPLGRSSEKDLVIHSKLLTPRFSMDEMVPRARTVGHESDT